MVTETTNNRKDPLNGTTITAVSLAGVSLLTQLLTGNLNLGGIAGGRPPAGDPPWTRDMSYERSLTTKDMEIAKLQAQIYTDDKVDTLRRELQAATAAQREYNVANTAAVASISAQTATLMKMTGTIINAPAMLSSEAAASAFKLNGASETANG